jgi:hypothetical protein
MDEGEEELVHTGMLCMLLLLPLLLLLTMLLRASRDVGVLIGGDACDVGGDFVVDYWMMIVVFAYDIDTESLLELIRTRNN